MPGTDWTVLPGPRSSSPPSSWSASSSASCWPPSSSSSTPGSKHYHPHHDHSFWPPSHDDQLPHRRHFPDDLIPRGGLPLWETLLSLDNQDHISTVGAFEEPVFIWKFWLSLLVLFLILDDECTYIPIYMEISPALKYKIQELLPLNEGFKVQTQPLVSAMELYWISEGQSLDSREWR